MCSLYSLPAPRPLDPGLGKEKGENGFMLVNWVVVYKPGEVFDPLSDAMDYPEDHRAPKAC